MLKQHRIGLRKALNALCLPSRLSCSAAVCQRLDCASEDIQNHRVLSLPLETGFTNVCQFIENLNFIYHTIDMKQTCIEITYTYLLRDGALHILEGCSRV